MTCQSDRPGKEENGITSPLFAIPFEGISKKVTAFSHAHVHSIVESMLVDKMCMNLQIHIRRAHIGTFLDKERWGQ